MNGSHILQRDIHRNILQDILVGEQGVMITISPFSVKNNYFVVINI